MTTSTKAFTFLRIVTRGIGQIMLQENSWTGVLFLLGIFIGSPVMAFAAFLGSGIGTMSAKLFGYNEQEIQQGLYGFSAALVGVALTFYFQPAWITWLAIVLGSVAAAMLQQVFIKKKLPLFTFPFVFVGWCFMYLFRNIYLLEMPTTASDSTALSDNFAFVFRSYGQVIFQENWLSGLLFFIGVFISSPLASLYGLAAALFAALLAQVFQMPANSIQMGLCGYNAVLCAIVFAGNKARDGFWASLAVMLSVLVLILMGRWRMTPLTFPFVASAALITIIKNKLTAA
jgi:urea transporter